MIEKAVESDWVRIYMAGPVEVAKQACREFCFDVGLCVNVAPREYIYTGGEEAGFCVEVVNYPRFPSTPVELVGTARSLAENLRLRCCQHSYLLMTPRETTWVSYREEKR